MKDYFYESESWARIRYRALRRDGYKCKSCGRSGRHVTLHVDHIKPRSKYPELELDLNNLQTMCQRCNVGKSNEYEDNLNVINDDQKWENYEMVREWVRSKSMPQLPQSNDIKNLIGSTFKLGETV